MPDCAPPATGDSTKHNQHLQAKRHLVVESLPCRGWNSSSSKKSLLKVSLHMVCAGQSSEYGPSGSPSATVHLIQPFQGLSTLANVGQPRPVSAHQQLKPISVVYTPAGWYGPPPYECTGATAHQLPSICSACMHYSTDVPPGPPWHGRYHGTTRNRMHSVTFLDQAGAGADSGGTPWVPAARDQISGAMLSNLIFLASSAGSGPSPPLGTQLQHPSATASSVQSTQGPMAHCFKR